MRLLISRVPGVIILLLSVVPAPAAPPGITNPTNFVAEVYGHFLKAQSKASSFTPPEDIFTARLGKLIRDDRRRAKGEVGCLDFVFWVNGQDWNITNLRVESGPVDNDRWTVIAKFLNIGSPQEIHFDFRRIEGRWLLEEVQSVKDSHWTLSDVLKCTS